MLQNVTSLRKSAPWPLNMFAGYVSCTAPATRNASLQILFKHPTPAVVFATAAKPTRLCGPRRTASWAAAFGTFWVRHVPHTKTAHTFWTSQVPKVLRTWCVLYILTWKYASRHNGMHFLNIWTSKVLRRWCALGIFTWKCASRHNGVHLFIIYLNVQKCSETSNASHHNGVQFLISHLTTRLHTRRFSEPTFRPSRATKHWKNTVFCDFSLFSRTWIFFLLTLSLLIVSFLWLLSPLLFPSVHTVRSLTSKLPSIMHTYICIYNINR